MDSLVEFSHAAVADEFRDFILSDPFRNDAVDFGILFHNAGVIDLELMGTDAFHVASMRNMFQFRNAFTVRTDNFHARRAPMSSFSI